MCLCTCLRIRTQGVYVCVYVFRYITCVCVHISVFTQSFHVWFSACLHTFVIPPWRCNCEQVSQVTLSRTVFVTNISRSGNSKEPRTLSPLIDVAFIEMYWVFALLSGSHGLLLGYNELNCVFASWYVLIWGQSHALLSITVLNLILCMYKSTLFASKNNGGIKLFFFQSNFTATLPFLCFHPPGIIA